MTKFIYKKITLVTYVVRIFYYISDEFQLWKEQL